MGQKSVILALQSSQRQTWPHGNKIILRRFWQQITHTCTSGCSFSWTFCCLSIWEEVCCFWVVFFSLRVRSLHHFRVISPTMTRPMPPHKNARNLHRDLKNTSTLIMPTWKHEPAKHNCKAWRCNITDYPIVIL